MNKKAFTLIELLVVVLIIGILAAVALPQYTKTVERSKAAEALTLVKNFADAEKIYYMETGASVKSTKDIPNLNIGFDNLKDSIAYPNSCYDYGSANFDICINENVVWFERKKANVRAGYYLSIYHIDTAADTTTRKVGVPYCCARNDFGTKACLSLNGKNPITVSGATCYEI